MIFRVGLLGALVTGGLWSSNAFAVPVFLPEVSTPFAAVGTGGHFEAAEGTFSSKRYWFYEPNLNPGGSSFIRFEFTDHTVSEGLLGKLAPGDTLGVILNILDASGRSVYHLVHQTLMDKPGKAQQYNVSFTPGQMATFRTVVLHPFTDSGEMDDAACGVALGISLGKDGVHGPLVATCAPETQQEINSEIPAD